MSLELNFEKEETIGNVLKQAGLCGSFQKEEEAVLKLKKITTPFMAWANGLTE